MASPNTLVVSSITNQAAQQVEQINQAHVEIDRGVWGQVDVISTGTLTNLTAEQYNRALIKINGTPTGAHTVTIPDRVGKSRPFIVWNNTAHNLTFKTTSGTGIVVDSLSLAHIWCDTLGDMKAIASGTGGGGGGGTDGHERATATVTTSSLADEAADTSKTVALGKGGIVYKISTSHPARVRAYINDAARDADEERPVETQGTSGTGLVAEVVTSLETPTIEMSPMAVYFNGDEDPNANIPLIVENLSGDTAVIAVQFTYLPLEA